jgi:3-deoxy-7-phosphoheptulonate synthase
VAADVGAQIASGDERIFGAMLEATSMPAVRIWCPARRSNTGVSITDACIGWDATLGVLDKLAEAVRARRVRRSDAS